MPLSNPGSQVTTSDQITDGIVTSADVKNDEIKNEDVKSDAAIVDTKISHDDEAYGVGWNGDTTAPTKNAVYDKIETMPQQQVWNLLADVELGSAAASINSGTFTAKKLLHVVIETYGKAGATESYLEFNQSGSLYNYKKSADGGAVTTQNNGAFGFKFESSAVATLIDFVVTNVSAQNKMYAGQVYEGEGDTAGTIYEFAGHWKYVAGQITEIRLRNPATNFNTGARIRVYGSND